MEAAIVFPVLALLALGAIEYGWMLLNAQKIGYAARQGARVAALYDANDSDGVDEIVAQLGDLVADVNEVVTADPDPDVYGDATVTATIIVDPNRVDLVKAHGLFPLPKKKFKAVVVMAKEGG